MLLDMDNVTRQLRIYANRVSTAIAAYESVRGLTAAGAAGDQVAAARDHARGAAVEALAQLTELADLDGEVAAAASVIWYRTALERGCSPAFAALLADRELGSGNPDRDARIAADAADFGIQAGEWP